MSYLPEFLTVVAIHFLAIISPGPDFIMISRNSLKYSRRVGVYSAVGLGLGIAVHVTYSLIGVGLIISKSILIFSILKYFGAAYLIYIGYQCLKAKPYQVQVVEQAEHEELGKVSAIRMGFLTNVLNPKATLFFLALFTQVIDPQTPKAMQVLYGVEMSIVTFLWFAFVAIVLSHKLIRARFIAVQHYVERTFGVILIGLGIKVALAPAK